MGLSARNRTGRSRRRPLTEACTRSQQPPRGLATKGVQCAPSAIQPPSPEAATMGPTALARAPRLRSVPMTVPFCPGEPVGEGTDHQVPASLPPGTASVKKKGLLTIAGDHRRQAGHHDSSSWQGTSGRRPSAQRRASGLGSWRDSQPPAPYCAPHPGRAHSPKE